MDNGADGRSDFGTAYLLPCLAAIDGGNGGVASGTVLTKVIHLATQVLHLTTLGVPCPTVPNRLSFDPILLGHKEDTDKIGSCACAQTGKGCVEGLLTKEELDFLDSERVVGFVGSSLAIFSRTEEEEESDPGEVADGLLTVGVGLVGLLEGLEDGDCNGTELGRNRVLFHVGCKLSSQEKSDLAQIVILGGRRPPRL